MSEVGVYYYPPLPSIGPKIFQNIFESRFSEKISLKISLKIFCSCNPIGGKMNPHLIQQNIIILGI